jgi:hypothetical protein
LGFDTCIDDGEPSERTYFAAALFGVLYIRTAVSVFPERPGHPYTSPSTSLASAIQPLGNGLPVCGGGRVEHLLDGRAQ